MTQLLTIIKAQYITLFVQCCYASPKFHATDWLSKHNRKRNYQWQILKPFIIYADLAICMLLLDDVNYE